MTQQTSPFLEGKYGWALGESGWNLGMDENLLKFSYLFDKNVDGVVSSLPPAVNGTAYFNTTDNLLYFVVGGIYHSSPTPKWFQFQVKTTGEIYLFNGTSVSQIDTPIETDSRLDVVESFNTTLGTPSGASAVFTINGQTVEQRLASLGKTILSYGTPTGTNDTALAQAMLDDTNTLIVPRGVTLAIKNLSLNDNTFVYCLGTLKLRSGCVDFDKILNVTSKTGINAYIAELDGNAAGQAGDIGTHLIYATDPVRCVFNVDYAHDHYYTTGSVIVNTDGIRDTSSGAIFFYRPIDGSTSIKYLKSWGREGIQCREGVRHAFHDMMCQGGTGNTEYSGIQMSGTLNSLHNAKVDSCGASGIGFDTTYGVGSNWVSVNSRENMGVNFGHPGFPATGSTVTNIQVDGAERHGIAIQSSTQDLSITNATIRNSGELGISMSDSALSAKLSNVLVEYAGFGNISSSGAGAVIQVRNAKFDLIDAGGVLLVTGVTGTYVAGETVSAGGVSGVVRNVLKDLTGAQQTLFLSSKTGTFVAAGTLIGGTSGASGTINTVRVPVARREASGGIVADDMNVVTGGLGTITKLPDGTAIFRNTIAAAATANTLLLVTTNFPSAATWVSAPTVTATVAAVNSTDTYDLTRISCSRTTADYTVRIKATVTQTYSVDVVAVGRWY